MLDGLVQTTPHLCRLDGFPSIKVVYDKNCTKEKVALISGGGSGHEPAHAGYVGAGMLSAAVCGDVFASPTTEAVLCAIRTVTGPTGCLLIVKNYTGDRIHFGLAAEQAKAEGYKVEMVVVGEDCAIEKPGLAGRRGLAGTVLVHKIAGAAAARGDSLAEVLSAAQAAASHMATLGVALSVCTLPGKATSDRLGADQMEVGLGIHGEPGVQTAPLASAADVTRLALDLVLDRGLALGPGAQAAALLVNGLGGTTAMELSVMARDALEYLQETRKVSVSRVLLGNLLTALDMQGVSFTLLAAPPGDAASLDATLALLDAPTSAPAWPRVGAVVPKAVQPTPLPGDGSGLEHAGSGGGPGARGGSGWSAQGREVLAAVAQALADVAPQLTEWDAKVGDGDCGDTFLRGARALQAALAHAPPAPPATHAHLTTATSAAAATITSTAAGVRDVASVVQSSMGGTSGGLYAVGLTAAATSLARPAGAAAERWSAALSAAASAVRKYGGAEPGCRTMIDALQPAAQAMEEAARAGASLAEATAAAAAAASSGVDATRSMAATAGRASYLPTEALAGVPDPGAAALCAWLQAAAQALAKAQP